MTSDRVDRMFQVSQRWRRHAALSWVVRFVEDQATGVVPPEGSTEPGFWLVAILRMTQRAPMTGPLVSRSIYSPAFEFQPCEHPNVVREIVWRSGADRLRPEHEPIHWPDVSIRYFEIQKDLSRPLDTALRALETAIGTPPLEVPGLSLLDPSYEPVMEGRESREADNQHVRILDWRLTSEHRQVSFREDAKSNVDAHWDEAWDILSTICLNDHEVQGYEAHYNVSPEALSRSIMQTVEDTRPQD
jgi:hypothetical protein